MFFRGHSQRNLDPKGRLMLPPEFRDILMQESSAGVCVLTINEGCIVGYPETVWNEFEQQFTRLRNASRTLRNFRRTFIGCSEMHTLDPQGRVRLSKEHLEYAKIDRNVLVVGQGHLFEIWDPEAFRALQDQDLGDVADELAEHGIDLPL